LWLSPKERRTAVDDELNESNSKLLDKSNKTMKSERFIDKEIAGKFQVISKTTDCDGKLKMSGKQLMV
jgi:hypothetical protein